MFKSNKLKKVSNPFKTSSRDKGNEQPKEESHSFSFPFKSSGSKSSDANPSESVPTSKKSTHTSGDSKLFDIRPISVSGLTGKIICMAYDCTQSLLAVATDALEIHLFGQKQIDVTMTLTTGAPIIDLEFVKGIYLVVVDAKDTVTVISLLSKRVLATFFSPSRITCIETDPSVDWLLLGLQSGSIMIYDVDRNQVSDVKIENLQKSYFFPKNKLSPVVSISWNPRDIGTILISYEQVTVTYSLVSGEVIQHFIYELPPYAPGGDFSTGVERARTPKIIQSLYHPNSLHMLTVHEDNSMVFWDVNTGKLIQARTLFDYNIHLTQDGSENPKSTAHAPRIYKVVWVCQKNPEYTYLVVATKPSVPNDTTQGITILDLGGTPLYSVTSYDAMAKYYAHPKQEKLCPLDRQTQCKDFIPIAKSSPYFAGGHNPTCLLILSEDGEIETMLFPSGIITSKASLLPQSLSWARSKTTVCSAVSAPNKLWLGMVSSNTKYDSILQGGVAGKKDLRVQNIRTVLLSGHKNGSVRVWDGAAGDLDDNSVFEVNLARILNRADQLSIEHISFAPDTLELAAATENGDVMLFKYEVNQYFDLQRKNATSDLDLNFSRFSLDGFKDPVIDVRDRSPYNIRQGLMPSTAVHLKKGKVTALENSNIWLCLSIAYQDGTLVLLDRRGPAIIYMDQVRSLTKQQSQYVTCISFAIMQNGEEQYSSILMLCGTNTGELIVNKVLPEQTGRFHVQYGDVIKGNDKGPVLKIESIAKETGYSCDASVIKMQDLAKGIAIPGFIIVTSDSDVRAVKIGKGKVASKSFKYPVACSGLSYVVAYNAKKERKLMSYIMVLLATGDIRALSVPDLKEVMSGHSPTPLNSKFARDSAVLKNGDMFSRTSEYKTVLFSTVIDPNSPQHQTQPEVDSLYNQHLRIPYRPQVNSLQWARGTIMCTTDQLDELLGGPRREPSKYKESEIAKGTLSLKPSEDSKPPGTPQPYKRASRNSGRSSSYGMMKSVSRAVETKLDNLEDQFNDYASAVGQGMNDAMEETGKDFVKGSFGF
ncbi:putative Rab GTPase-binding protein SRO77 KNAG_0C04300 [Huiozyma naganishii CBS 8797]|uniref:Lethal giant larvae (Lgl)-like C-terminal domain-containing protein n=1 Tax=Huiozyma naganishii (strain ATCC MYA-139 / BCRC 22969 / CBS 8797 / KCTC 17520 / NBRC 10181 / NCYC 3082 / Yp74L-3) TaxID=1071383 RepID=J7RWY2_HUIN7|nr:hypothetical protein KNAG_0C04300 [Kazachstania naganishii CBS 8797]CCK69532.1 hypothetical protein KNAG_0C04300 [Kazachstania naganishii CBS 8797]